MNTLNLLGNKTERFLMANLKNVKMVIDQLNGSSKKPLRQQVFVLSLERISSCAALTHTQKCFISFVFLSYRWCDSKQRRSSIMSFSVSMVVNCCFRILWVENKINATDTDELGKIKSVHLNNQERRVIIFKCLLLAVSSIRGLFNLILLNTDSVTR